MNVVVVGAGGIGLSCAYHLARRGATVTVLDSASPGAGASRHNAGWVVPSMTGPVPSPEALRSGLGWMLRHDSPLHIHPPTTPGAAAFLLQMVRNCTTSRHARGARATAELARGSHESFRELERDGVHFEHHRHGLLYLFINRRSAEAHASALVTSSATDGSAVGRLLDGDGARALEPAVSDAVVAAVVRDDETNLDPISLMDGLAARCRQLGVRIVAGERAELADVRGDRLTAVIGSRRWVADHYVVAAGVWSSGVLRAAGVRLPVHAGKGYGYDLRPAPVPLRHAVYLYDHKVALSPLDDRLRVSGTMEFGTTGHAIDARRARAVAESAVPYFRQWPGPEQLPAPWSGLRPMTPDGLPILGRPKALANLTVATGHAMLGITLAPVTGALIADSVLTGEPAPELEPFTPDRFIRHRWLR